MTSGDLPALHAPEWERKLRLLGACTPVIDKLHAVMSVRGERFK
jgi:hypothetical protein